MTDTIVAPATPPGIGGVAIIRISGPKTVTIAKNILGTCPKPRYATFSHFRDDDNSVLDEGIALFFPKPNSFTGEDVLELHGHGGIAVLDRVLRRVLTLGARLANPGEFSERAFLNDKIDLIQAEAIADLIESTTEAGARSAIRSLQGEFSKKVNKLVESLIHLRTYVEAAIDFVEEEIDFLKNDEIQLQLLEMIRQVDLLEKIAKEGSLLRDGITIVIAGEPNVGKSSLLNCLTGKESAIVTSIAGTTRDILREYISIDGIPIHLIDTAGLRESDDVVEQEGIKRAHREISQADLVLWVTDVLKNDFNHSFSQKTLIVRNKIDLVDETPHYKKINEKEIVSISAQSGNGILLLKNTIKNIIGFTSSFEDTFSARKRHQDALRRAQCFLQNAKNVFAQKSGELLAEELRLAQLALSEITGDFTTDDLLGRIFSSFCIGK